MFTTFSLWAQNYSAPTGAGSSGTDNTSLGTSSGSAGSYNISVGKLSGDVVTGSNNSFFGTNAGKVNTSANSNVFIGSSSGLSTTTGGTNTFIGYRSGYSNVTGTGNVFIGNDAGYSETTSSKLYIDNSNTATPLIYGDFSANQVGINAKPTSTHALSVGGTLYSSGALYAPSLVINGIQVKGWSISGSNVYYNSGAVSIGTTNIPSGFQLAVGGKIITEEVVIKLQANWPDYVFEDDYKLPALAEVREYIRVNKHLPEIPPASEIKENGLSVGEMNVLLMKKIEELTLYVLSLEERIDKIQSNEKIESNEK
jgi:hypothetical protein